jgi:hypothetical protein
MSVDKVASVGTRIDVVAIGVNLLLLAEGTESVCGKDLRT